MSLKQRCYEILESPHPNDRVARRWNGLIVGAIVANTAAMMLETVNGLQGQYSSALVVLEFASVIVFGAEYGLRIWAITCSPKYAHPFYGRLRYAVTPRALIDLFAILPSLFATRIDLRFIRLARVIRMARMLKFGRYSRALDLVSSVVRDRAGDLSIAVALIMLLLVAASSLMYFAEHDAQPEAFSSIPATLWWGVTTITTVGYGDVYPVTLAGRLIAGVVALLGIGAFALPTSILGAGFLAQSSHKHEIEGDNCPTCGTPLRNIT